MFQDFSRSHHRRGSVTLYAGLRTLLVVFGLALLVGGPQLACVQSSRAQWRAAGELERLGAKVTWSWRLDDRIYECKYPVYEPPRFVLPGDSFVVGVHLLYCQDRQLNEKLGALRGLSGLRSLALTNASVDETGFRQLAGLTCLDWVDLHDTPLTDDALRHLSAFKALERLNLQNTQITDAVLPFLTRFTRLRWLNLIGTRVTPTGVNFLQQRLPNAEIVLDPVLLQDSAKPSAWTVESARRPAHARHGRISVRRVTN